MYKLLVTACVHGNTNPHSLVVEFPSREDSEAAAVALERYSADCVWLTYAVVRLYVAEGKP